MDNDINLMVATPSGRGQVEVGYMHSCLGLQKSFLEKQWKISFSFIAGAILHRQRNELVSRFLNNSKYTHILFVDSDIQFDPEAVTRMLFLNKEVIGGVCPYKKYTHGELSYNIVEKDNASEAHHHEARALEVKRIGTGFLLIKRGVFDQIKPHAAEVVYNSSSEERGNKSINRISTSSFFDFSIDEHGVEQGEDFSFCEKLNKAGIKIWALDPHNERFVHWGLHGYGLQ
ncbi:hypothetical protein CL634_05825 [bacterium]|nr:hypothetical protein [bacterium]